MAPQHPEEEEISAASNKPVDKSHSEGSDSDDHSNSASEEQDLAPPSNKPLNAESEAEESPTGPKINNVTAPTETPKNVTPPPARKKRGNEETEGEEGNKAKRGRNEQVAVDVQKSAQSTSNHLFQKIWSDDDEIKLLQGLVIKYSRKGNGVDPAEMQIHWSDFYNSIKPCISFDVNLSQVKDKVRKLKAKFLNHFNKGTGEGTRFTEPHHQLCSDLSMMIWGSSNAKTTTLRPRRNINNNEEVSCRVPLRMDKKWNNFYAASFELMIKRYALLIDEANLMRASMDEDD